MNVAQFFVDRDGPDEPEAHGRRGRGGHRQGPAGHARDVHRSTRIRTADVHGTVNAVRLNATTQNNVVTYPVWIDVPNPDLKLRPSMTAQVKIIISTGENVVRVPNQALALQAEQRTSTRRSGLQAPPAGQGRRRVARTRRTPAVPTAQGAGGAGRERRRRLARPAAPRRAPNNDPAAPPPAPAASAQPGSADSAGSPARWRRAARPAARAAQSGRPPAASRSRQRTRRRSAPAQQCHGFGDSGDMSNLTPEQRPARCMDRGGRGGGAGGGRGGGGSGRGNRTQQPRTS